MRVAGPSPGTSASAPIYAEWDVMGYTQLLHENYGAYFQSTIGHSYLEYCILYPPRPSGIQSPRSRRIHNPAEREARHIIAGVENRGCTTSESICFHPAAR